MTRAPGLVLSTRSMDSVRCAGPLTDGPALTGEAGPSAATGGELGEKAGGAVHRQGLDCLDAELGGDEAAGDGAGKLRLGPPRRRRLPATRPARGREDTLSAEVAEAALQIAGIERRLDDAEGAEARFALAAVDTSLGGEEDFERAPARDRAGQADEEAAEGEEAGDLVATTGELPLEPGGHGLQPDGVTHQAEPEHDLAPVAGAAGAEMPAPEAGLAGEGKGGEGFGGEVDRQAFEEPVDVEGAALAHAGLDERSGEVVGGGAALASVAHQQAGAGDGDRQAASRRLLEECLAHAFGLGVAQGHQAQMRQHRCSLVDGGRATLDEARGDGRDEADTLGSTGAGEADGLEGAADIGLPQAAIALRPADLGRTVHDVVDGLGEEVVGALVEAEPGCCGRAVMDADALAPLAALEPERGKQGVDPGLGRGRAFGTDEEMQPARRGQEQLVDEVAAEEAGAAGDQDLVPGRRRPGLEALSPSGSRASSAACARSAGRCGWAGEGTGSVSFDIAVPQGFLGLVLRQTMVCMARSRRRSNSSTGARKICPRK